MSYWIYSPEALPNPDMMGMPFYTPDNDWIKWGGVALPAVPKGQWTRLPDEMETRRRTSWRDPWQEVIIPIKKYQQVVNSANGPFASRGVVMLDHEPTDKEKEKLEAKAGELNLRSRKRAVEFFESQRKAAEARQGTYEPSPYIDECYEMLQMKKPYSMEALRAQRDPGREAAREMAEAMRDVFRAERQAAANEVAAQLTKPEPPKQVHQPAK